MKKILILFIIFLTGCSDSLGNTPTKEVRKLFDSYQEGKATVSSSLIDNAWTEEEKGEYNTLMKKHYQNLRYDVSSEKINGNRAKVYVVVRVTDYSDVLSDANVYYAVHPYEFDDTNDFIDYKLNKMKKVKNKIDYVIIIKLKKSENKWKILGLNQKSKDKINGIYNIKEYTDYSNLLDTSDIYKYYPQDGRSTAVS